MADSEPGSIVACLSRQITGDGAIAESKEATIASDSSLARKKDSKPPRTEEDPLPEGEELPWLMACLRAEGTKNERIHITCYPSNSIFTMIWYPHERTAITGVRDDLSKRKNLVIRQWTFDENHPFWLRETHHPLGVRPDDVSIIQDPLRVNALCRELRALRSVNTCRNKYDWGISTHLKHHHTQELGHWLEKLKDKKDNQLVAMLDSVIYQASQGEYSLRNLQGSGWWTLKHPLPSKEQQKAWATKFPESHKPVASDEAEGPIDDASNKPDESEQGWLCENWYLAKSFDDKGCEKLHLTRFPSKQFFSLVWMPDYQCGHSGTRCDADLKGPLHITGWEYATVPEDDYLRSFEELFLESDEQGTATELKALRAVLERDERTRGEVDCTPEPVKAYLKSQPLEPYPLEYYLNELKQSEWWREGRLNAVVIRASDHSLTILDAMTSDLANDLHSLGNPEQPEASVGLSLQLTGRSAKRSKVLPQEQGF